MIADIYFLHLLDGEDSDWGAWSVEALMVDGTIVPGTIIGDGRGGWDEDTFKPYEDDFVSDPLYT